MLDQRTRSLTILARIQAAIGAAIAIAVFATYGFAPNFLPDATLSLTSAILGVSMLVVGAAGAVEPASARSNVGVYVGPNGIGISVERYRSLCRDYWYRRHHPYRCDQFYGHRYYPSYNYRYNDRWRYRHRDRHHYRGYDRDRRYPW